MLTLVVRSWRGDAEEKTLKNSQNIHQHLPVDERHIEKKGNLWMRLENN